MLEDSNCENCSLLFETDVKKKHCCKEPNQEKSHPQKKGPTHQVSHKNVLNVLQHLVFEYSERRGTVDMDENI